MTDPTSAEQTSLEVTVGQLKNIAESGNVDIEWSNLQQALQQRLKEVLDNYLERNTDDKEKQYQEPNVEKFNLDNSRDEILELISTFSEAPFTIQRICELLYSPFEYYDRVSTFLRGLEKNLRVISSTNCPKSRINSSNDGIISNSRMDPPQQPSDVQDQGLRILPGT